MGKATDIIPPMLQNVIGADQPMNSLSGEACSPTKSGLLA